MNKKIVMIVLALLVGAGAGFFGGVKYQTAKAAKAGPSGRGQFAQGSGTFFRRGAGQNGMSFTAGQVISQDNNSLTVKLMNGGSQIVLLAPSTQYRKAVDGTSADVSVGTQVTVTGTNNSDGSLTAQQVQIRGSANSTPQN